jgi:23S rRNA pseudouridine1911/1915/1917 synthase
MSMQILYEDKNILAINKPAGLVVHGDGKSDQKTLVDFLLEKYPEISEVGESMFLNDKDRTEIKRSGIVHRLDKETSGVMLVAKTKEGFDFLKNQFQNREIEKIYHAFVYGNIKPNFVPPAGGTNIGPNDFVITSPIGRSSGDIRKWSAGKDARGEMREAETEITVLKRGKVETESVTFVEAKPKTGRTHQIRVHLNSINHPIIGDSIYTKRKSLLGFERVALHSKNIYFKNLEGEIVKIEADYPEDFIYALKLFV